MGRRSYRPAGAPYRRPRRRHLRLGRLRRPRHTALLSTTTQRHHLTQKARPCPTFCASTPRPPAASYSRQVADTFAEAWGGDVVQRDLALNPLGHLDAAGITARTTPAHQHAPEQRTVATLQDELVEEFLGASSYLFAVPMYNYSMPSVFKAQRSGRRVQEFQCGLLAGRLGHCRTARRERTLPHSILTAREPRWRYMVAPSRVSDREILQSRNRQFGRLCDAIEDAGIDSIHWTGHDIANTLHRNTQRGWTWPSETKSDHRSPFSASD
ncbi:NAD(P)H-dependent oxidoreductase [Rhodococcus sp. NPDC127530]|uniref:NAD(P)H-dependent oxidoreductase n=1 Tax=unclassified Rhodococcus (in: high G+C Gram-positive bacteria) TaxID=192944 RepID=UPI003633BC9F